MVAYFLEYDVSSKEHMSEVTTTITDGVGIQTFISKEKIIHSMKFQKKELSKFAEEKIF